jgi:hypothetical protein
MFTVISCASIFGFAGVAGFEVRCGARTKFCVRPETRDREISQE